MNSTIRILLICLVISFATDAREVIKQHYPSIKQSPVYHGAQLNKQLAEQTPVNLKVYKSNPPKIVARYGSPKMNPSRFYRPVVSAPAIRRRYQLSNGPQVQQKRMTSSNYPPTSYSKMRRYPTKSYKYPFYYKKSGGPPSKYNPEIRKGNYQSQGSPPLEPKISSNQGYHRINSYNKKQFYPSPHFDGKIIVKPNAKQQKYVNGYPLDSPIGKTQYASSGLSQFVNFPEQSEHLSQFKAPGRHQPIHNHPEYYNEQHYADIVPPHKQYYGNSEINEKSPAQISDNAGKYSSYAVYDETEFDDDENNENYATESPVKYYVQTTESSNSGGGGYDDDEDDEAKKYLDFMSSRNYFLPKVSPDYHTKAVGYNNYHFQSSTEPIATKLNNNDLYQNYKSQRINLEPGSSTGIRISSKIAASAGGGSGATSNIANNGNGNNDNSGSIIMGHHGHQNQQFVNQQQQQQQQSQNTYYRPNRKHQQIMYQPGGPEKIEFTESDAIHSSYTSNPKEILDQSESSLIHGGGVGYSSIGSNSNSNLASAVDDIKAKYGLSPKYKVSYQSSKINHYLPHHRVSKYKPEVRFNHNNNDNNDNDNNNDNNNNNNDENNDDTDNDDNDDDTNQK